MKVLFIARPNLFQSRGGDTVQIESTAAYLQKMGVEVTLYAGNRKALDLDAYDVIHYFNLIDPEDIVGFLNKVHKPQVLSTIYLKYEEYDRSQRKGMIGLLGKFLSYEQVEYVKTLAKWILKGEQISSLRYLLWGHKGSMQRILHSVDYLLPNSTSELKRLQQDLVVNAPHAVVTNAFDDSVFTDTLCEKEPFVLCVARFEGNKNQINLIKAASLLNVQVVLVGKASPNQQSYLAACRAIAPSNVVFKGFVSLDELISLYARAKVHVLPSWFETTGLSSLEAAAMGCNIVVTDKGDVKEYFGDLAYYCDPDSPESIARAIEQALNNPVNPKLKQQVRSLRTWEKAAEQTYSVYKKVLKYD